MTDLLAGVYDAALCHCGQESSHWEAPVTLNTLHLQSRKHHISPVRSSEPGVTFFQILLAAADVALEPKTAPPPVPIFSQSAVFLYYWLPVSFHTPRNIWSDHLCVPPAAQEPICSDRLLGFVLSTWPKCFHRLPWGAWGAQCCWNDRSVTNPLCLLPRILPRYLLLEARGVCLPLVSFQRSHPHVKMEITSEWKTHSLVFKFIFSMTNFV